MHTPPEPLHPHIPDSVFKPAQFLMALGSGLLGICPLLSLSSSSWHLFLAWSFWILYPCLWRVSATLGVLLLAQEGSPWLVVLCLLRKLNWQGKTFSLRIVRARPGKSCPKPPGALQVQNSPALFPCCFPLAIADCCQNEPRQRLRTASQLQLWSYADANAWGLLGAYEKFRHNLLAGINLAPSLRCVCLCVWCMLCLLIGMKLYRTGTSWTIMGERCWAKPSSVEDIS